MKLVILDRDGVINEDSTDYIKSPEEWRPIPGSLEAIARLNHAGYKVYVASNQSGLGRGLFDIEALNAIHLKLHLELQKHGGRIEAILFCPHRPEEACSCRKPRPGLYQQIAQRTHQSLLDVPIIGDSLRDLEAALAVQARPILVLTGNGRRALLELAQHSTPGLAQPETYEDLAQAVDAILAKVEAS